MMGHLMRLMVEKSTYGGTAENPRASQESSVKTSYELFKNIELVDGEFEQFEKMLELRFEVVGITSSTQKLDILLSRLSKSQQESWQLMRSDIRNDYDSVKKHLQRIFGGRGIMIKKEF